jgi:hypothetical protein
MSDDKKPFTVNDRRLFTPEGEARSNAADREPDTVREGPSAAAESPPRPEDDAGSSLDFIGLLVSLGAQASSLLGMGGGPEGASGSVTVDLPGARGVIGLLEVLERKTEGRRTPEEDQVLAGLLYELRMAYLARAR